MGEGPGRNEDREGKPFVGAGGKLLDELLRNAGLDRDRVYITNIVKCRPPNNRKPEDDEVEICTSTYLERQLDLLKPLLVCTLGATALEYLQARARWASLTVSYKNEKRNSTPPNLPPSRDFQESVLSGALAGRSQKDSRSSFRSQNVAATKADDPHELLALKFQKA